jgi:phospholipase C
MKGKDGMSRPYLHKLCTISILTSLAAFVASLAGCGGGTSSTPSPSPPGLLSQKIQHVVVIFQENRTPDNLFHGLAGADIADAGVNSAGLSIPLTPIALANDYDLSHAHEAFVKMYDGGKMDGADKVGVACAKTATDCPPPNPQFKYVNPSDVAPYFQLAEQYTFADRMFQTNQGPSFPAHQFIIAGTSAPTASSNLYAAENPVLPQWGSEVGCNAPAGAYVLLIDPSGEESSKQYPCFEHPTLVDLLDSMTLSWRYYTPSPGSLCTAPNAIQHLRFGPDWATNVINSQTQVLSDIANGQLPKVSWVIPTGQASDHPLSNDGSGPSWVASIVNAIGNSSYWSTTAIFITWDDWGGWYDHVAPPIYDSYEYGFRVPLIVVSPYAKRSYVSHVTHDFGSILKFIEKDFNLSSLGYADARADDLLDCFDLSQSPISFQSVSANYDASYFINDRRPPLPPDDD